MATDEEAQAFLDGIGGPALSFKQDGAGYIGRTVSMHVGDQTDPKTGDVKTFPNGDPMRQLVITLDTGLRDEANEGDDGERRWFTTYMAAKAFKAALRAARTDFMPGLTVAVVHSSTLEPTKKGLDGQKVYAVKVWGPGVTPDPDEKVGPSTVADLLAMTADVVEEPF